MKYIVTLFAHGSASYSVEAKSRDDAKEKASELANLDDVELSDWSFDIEPEVQRDFDKGSK